MNFISLSSNQEKASKSAGTVISISAFMTITIACIALIASFVDVVSSMKRNIRSTIASGRASMSRDYMEDIEHEANNLQHMVDTSLVIGIICILLLAVGGTLFLFGLSRKLAGKLAYVFTAVCTVFAFVAFFIYVPARINDLETRVTDPFCIGYECQGKSPEGTNCESDAQSLRRLTAEVNTESIRGRLEMKYSKFCRANWVVWTRDSSQPIPASPELWMKDESGSAVGIADKFKGPSSEKYVWSGMVSAKGDTCMALRLYASSGDSGESNKVYEMCSSGIPG